MFLGTAMPLGVYVTLINETNQDLEALTYQFYNYTFHKVGKIKKNDRRQVFLMTNEMDKDCDLIIENDGKQYVLEGIVKKRTHDKPRIFYFYRIGIQDGQLVFTEDKERLEAYLKRS